ncbi:hypothetical protein [Stenomitos frigidus]|uniref:Uncharacterized protein n=1 Tax=Stenomitos frigidus ULC18 TaxID=2107698 RepID=A0A2T1DVJ7_9CYAN|nr:hypothetical protein [Stenomitos frigidus]PSB24536.1 hypothetical protein C7B82_26270 [Stenomitos frigidus ULC18]
METIRQVIEVKGDRKVEITLPDIIQPGLVEMVVVVQSMPQTDFETVPSSNLFGFLPRRIDPLQFQRQLRDEWNR